jgi:Zn-dependent M28 family amino/carboxypeptidase
VVVVGAHLDSVPRGPGINDNGSGSGALLEIAEVYAAQGRETRNKLRFMWFGAEEFGLLGSRHYVSTLSQEQRDDIELMLNFDMVGSPNYVRFVYDGDNSMCETIPPATGCPGAIGPPGSAFIESVFVDYFNSQGQANEPTLFSGRSDYGPFIEAGIPAGGLFTGAEGIKTTAQAATYGGTAGAQYDPCYHLACDTFAGTGSGPGATSPGLAVKALDEMSDAIAHAVLTFARTKIDVAQTEAATALRSSGSPAQLDFGPETDEDRVTE